jgi:hypothetical protein
MTFVKQSAWSDYSTSTRRKGVDKDKAERTYEDTRSPALGTPRGGLIQHICRVLDDNAFHTCDLGDDDSLLLDNI